jgi:hypothetical protein
VILTLLAVTLAPLELLLPKVPVSGVVRDRTTGAPVAGASVKLGQATLRTDTQGRFALERVSPTEQIQVDAEGYQQGHSRIWPQTEHAVVLTARSFGLTVRDSETGDRVADVSATAPGIRVAPDETGNLRIDAARNGATITVSAPGFRDAVIRYRGEAELVAHLQPRILGAVMDGMTGRPIPDAFLTDGEMVATSNADGYFELERRPQGPIRVLAPGYRRLELDGSQDRILAARMEPHSVRAAYLTHLGVGDRTLRENVLSLAAKTEVNAVVIDIKTDRGKLAYRSNSPLAEAIGAHAETTIPNIDEMMVQLRARNIYTIARISVFKDELLARNGERAGLDLAVKDRLGERPWTDADGRAWVDPLRPEVWEYNVALAREAARKGFDEIQFDDVRFPVEQGSSGLSATQARYSRPWITTRDRVDAISGFLRQAREEVHLAGAFVSINLMGYVAWNEDDNGVGHDLAMLAGLVDYLCPTFYPSSFRAGLPGILNYPQVIQRPHDVVFKSVQQLRSRTADRGAAVRPWLQYFDDYSWQTGRPYRAAEIDAQRTGALSAGATGWMMWDPSNRYARGGLGARP